MEKNSKIYIAGHTGLVGSAITRHLENKGFSNLVVRRKNELDLESQSHVESFFSAEEPEYVFLAAAKVGGIMANKTYPAEFIYNNLLIQVNVINSAYKSGVKKLLFLGSSCIYPKNSPQPIMEDFLLSSPLESTNEAYAVAKIAGLKMCRYYNEQYGTDFIAVMPTNLYGPNDNYDLNDSHVLPAFIRKMFIAKHLEENNWQGLLEDLEKYPVRDLSRSSSKADISAVLEDMGIVRDSRGGVILRLWGSGSPRREFLHVDDLADAVVFLMDNSSSREIGEVINIGSGKDISIKELADMIRSEVGFTGQLQWDSSKPDGTPRKLLNVERLKKLGWQYRITLEEGVRMAVEDYRNQF